MLQLRDMAEQHSQLRSQASFRPLISYELVSYDKLLIVADQRYFVQLRSGCRLSGQNYQGSLQASHRPVQKDRNLGPACRRWWLMQGLTYARPPFSLTLQAVHCQNAVKRRWHAGRSPLQAHLAATLCFAIPVSLACADAKHLCDQTWTRELQVECAHHSPPYHSEARRHVPAPAQPSASLRLAALKSLWPHALH